MSKIELKQKIDVLISGYLSDVYKLRERWDTSAGTEKTNLIDEILDRNAKVSDDIIILVNSTVWRLKA